MRKIYTVIFIGFLGLLVSFQPKSIRKNGGIVLDLEVGDSQTSTADVSKTANIIKKRVESLCTSTPVFTIIGKSIHIEMPLISDTMVCKTFLIQKGEFEIAKTFELIDVIHYLVDINDSLNNNKNYSLKIPSDTTLKRDNLLFKMLQLNIKNDSQLQNGPLVGWASSKDTALINAIFTYPKLSVLLPPDLNFQWAKERNYKEQELYNLIAIKRTNSEKLITSEMIADVSLDKNYGRYGIMIIFKPEYYSLWKKITSESTGKSIAIIIDNEVVSYPIVQNEISGGKSSISANFTKEEATGLVALLKNGILPASVKIKKMTLVKP